MDTYSKYGVNITESQRRKLSRAIRARSDTSLKLSAEDLSGEFPLLLTSRQITRIQKSAAKGVGLVLKLSASQLDAMRKDGGILPFLIPILVALGTGAASAAGAYGVNKIIEKAEGRGLTQIGVGSGMPSPTKKKEEYEPYQGPLAEGKGLFQFGVPHKKGSH